jgi:hypothetical protein
VLFAVVKTHETKNLFLLWQVKCIVLDSVYCTIGGVVREMADKYVGKVPILPFRSMIEPAVEVGFVFCAPGPLISQKSLRVCFACLRFGALLTRGLKFVTLDAAIASELRRGLCINHATTYHR